MNPMRKNKLVAVLVLLIRLISKLSLQNIFLKMQRYEQYGSVGVVFNNQILSLRKGFGLDRYLSGVRGAIES